MEGPLATIAFDAGRYTGPSDNGATVAIDSQNGRAASDGDSQYCGRKIVLHGYGYRVGLLKQLATRLLRIRRTKDHRVWE